jgi:hypothetical protein
MTHIVDDWAKDKPRYKELSPLILKLINQTPKGTYIKDHAEARRFLDGLYDRAVRQVRAQEFKALMVGVFKVLGILILTPVALVAVLISIAVPPIGLSLLLVVCVWLLIWNENQQKPDPYVAEYYRAQYAANRAIEEHYR